VLRDGPMPIDLFEVELAKRMGWTLTQLDAEDMARVLPGLHASSARDALEAVMNHVRTQGKVKPSDEALQVYDEITELMKDG